MKPHYVDQALAITKLVVGPMDNNVYIVTCGSTNEAVIIDAATEVDSILDALGEIRPRAVLTTHGHADHIQAAPEVCRRLGIPFRIHPADVPLAGLDTSQPIADGELIEVGDLVITALHTPGHTPGSTCFLVGEHLFSGDTLFPGGPGATRFPYSNFDTIMESLDRRLFVLPDETVVYPGHGADTTIGAERSDLETWRARRW
jgi:glyoxylase-like metal-dependent hydrolase (beta-lactamase superfamily II)